MSEPARQALAEQLDAIRDAATALIPLDRRDLEAAWHQAHTALEALPRPATPNRSASGIGPGL